LWERLKTEVFRRSLYCHFPTAIPAISVLLDTRKGLSQEKLAEKAGISTPFIGMTEVSRKFPLPKCWIGLPEP
jgi:hypothetical protein